MVTMAEIDVARAAATMALGALCQVPGSLTWKERLEEARTEIERLLREWWAQGCREESNLTRRVLKAEDAARLAEAGERDVRNALRDAIDRARGACAASPTAEPSAVDWIDELIGLLRVTRGQRDDAEARWQKEVLELRAKLDTANEELAATNHAAKELDAMNRRIFFDRTRLATAVQDALKVLHDPTGDRGVAAEILAFGITAAAKTRVGDSPTDREILARADHLSPFWQKMATGPKIPLWPSGPSKTCGDCHDWIMGGNGVRARCRLYEIPHDASDAACPRFIRRKP